MTAFAPPLPTADPIDAPPRALPAPVFELRCAEAHPVRCRHLLRASSAEGVLDLALEHGRHAHGFTKAWYTDGRLATMTAAVALRLG